MTGTTRRAAERAGHLSAGRGGATCDRVTPTVDAILEDDAWRALDLPALAERAARAALSDARLDPGAHEIALLACDDARIAALNEAFRGRGAATNVLSWPAAALIPGDAPPAALGDVAIAHGTCAREAAAQGKRLEDHVAHLIVHAVLHLLGHDHAGEDDAALMEGTERRILASIGVPDPYAGEDAGPIPPDEAPDTA